MDMKTTTHRFHSGRRLSGFRVVLAAIAVFVCISPVALEAQSILYKSRLGEKVIVESGGASQVAEKVRSAAPGTLMEVLVKVGDTVKKGQVLAHTELAATKYQLDMARVALENNATINAMQGQADAWTVTREETEEALRKRQVEKSRVEWAAGMEKFFRGSYEAQLEQKKVQRIQYEYWKEQYEAHFFRASVDGVVSEVLLDVGMPVGLATHVFTVGNEESYMIPVSVPAELASEVAPDGTLPVRASNGKHVGRGLVDSIMDDPKSPGKKIIKLLLNEREFPTETRDNFSGMKFDVLLPQNELAQQDNPLPAGEATPAAPAAPATKTAKQ